MPENTQESEAIKDNGVTVEPDAVVNEILPFCAQGQVGRDLLSQAEYAGDMQRNIGHQPGIARAMLANKHARQTAHMAAGLAQFLARRYAPGVVDDGDLDKIEAALVAGCKAIFQAMGLPLATTEKAGIVQIGQGLDISESGLLTIQNQTAALATCATAGSVAVKELAIEGFELRPGAKLDVLFSEVSSVDAPHLSINEGISKPIIWQGANLAAGALLADIVYQLVYTGSAWQIMSGMGPWDCHPLRSPIPVQNVTFSGRNPIMPGETVARTNWLLCDGGTDGLGGNVPDLRGKFLLGADDDHPAGSTGGSEEHTHSLSGSVGSTTLSESQLASHYHYIMGDNMEQPYHVGKIAFSISNANAPYPMAAKVDTGGTWNYQLYLSTNSTATNRGRTSAPGGSTSSDSHTHALSGTTGSGELPPYYALAYLIRIR